MLLSMFVLMDIVFIYDLSVNHRTRSDRDIANSASLHSKTACLANSLWHSQPFYTKSVIANYQLVFLQHYTLLENLSIHLTCHIETSLKGMDPKRQNPLRRRIYTLKYCLVKRRLYSKLMTKLYVALL